MFEGLCGRDAFERFVLEQLADQVHALGRGLGIEAGRDALRLHLVQGWLRVFRINSLGLF